MSKRRSYVFIALVLALLIIAGLAAILTRNSIDEPDKPDPQETPEQSQEIVVPTDTPEPTGTPAPTETPEPTESPIPSELPTREVSGSGSFRSDTGTNLNMLVKWSASAKDNDEVNVKFDVYLTSYSIGVGARVGTLTVDGTSRSFSTEGIDISNNKSVTETLIHSESVSVPVEFGKTVSIPVSVSWIYNGSYNGKDLETVTAEDVIIING